MITVKDAQENYVGINLNSAIPSNIALNYVNNSSTKEGITKATIGSGNINN